MRYKGKGNVGVKSRESLIFFKLNIKKVLASTSTDRARKRRRRELGSQGPYRVIRKVKLKVLLSLNKLTNLGTNLKKKESFIERRLAERKTRLSMRKREFGLSYLDNSFSF